jgi:hypothetical protein
VFAVLGRVTTSPSRQEVAMPTVIHFIGGQDECIVEDDYQTVTTTFHGGDAGHFTRVVGDSRSLVTMYKAAISYIEEREDVEPWVASA